jgi:hypothetical protein
VRQNKQAVGRALALCHALLSEQGEVSGRRVAAYALSAYQSLSPEGRELFFDSLVTDFAPDPKEVDAAADRYRANASAANLIRLQTAVEPPRQELFRRANMAPGGTAILLDMRRELLKTLPEHPERVAIDADLVHLFRSWFNRGFLVLQRIDWHTPAVILERLIQYEAVHEIQGWGDLHRRLEGDRRCYAFFHPVLPEEPLVFIEVALTRKMSAAVQPLLDPQSPIGDVSKANCAIFYSITNCQEGLKGVSFGNFLIKQVVDDLGRELPRLSTFATLSPIPGFCQWLRAEGAGQGALEDARGAARRGAEGARARRRRRSSKPARRDHGALRRVPAARPAQQRAGGCRRAVSSGQRGTPRTLELDGRPVEERRPPVARPDGELRVSARRPRAQSRGVREARQDRRRPAIRYALPLRPV